MSTNGRNGGDDEIMLGESLKSSSEKQTVDDAMLGRAYTPEKSFSVAPRPTEVGELHSTETPEERFVELQRLTDGYLTDDERDMLSARSASPTRRTKASRANRASPISSTRSRSPSS